MMVSDLMVETWNLMILSSVVFLVVVPLVVHAES
jgi:hypothetical protein